MSLALVTTPQKVLLSTTRANANKTYGLVTPFLNSRQSKRQLDIRACMRFHLPSSNLQIQSEGRYVKGLWMYQLVPPVQRLSSQTCQLSNG